MAEHNDLGKLGEQLAKDALVSNGYQILEVNYRLGRDEVDIIARVKDVIVFVEVKTRESNYMGEPEETVTPSKQKRIIRVAHHYMVTHNLELEGRFDIFGIIVNQKGRYLNHIEGAFSPVW